MDDEPQTIRFDAGWLALGWLSVAEASSKDPGRPALDRTVCIEFYGDGVRLVATDSYMLMTTWVPAEGKEDQDPPGIDEAPDSVVVAIDEKGRGKGLFGYLLGLLRAKHPPEIGVTLTTGPAPEITGPALVFDGVGRECVTVAADDREALLLDVYEGEFPTWRPLTAGFKPVRTAVISLNPDLVARVARVGRLHSDHVLNWSFGGQEKAAKVTVGDSPEVLGLVMPVRWTGKEEVGVSPDVKDEDGE